MRIWNWARLLRTQVRGRRDQGLQRTRKNIGQFETCEARIALHAGHDDPDVTSPAIWGPPEIAVASPAPVAGAVHPLTDLPILSGLPSATVKLYLDFDGGYMFSTDDYRLPAFSRDEDGNTFSDAELTEIENVFNRVVEFFSPFNIDVTTSDPIVYETNRVSRIIITNDNSGAFAYIGSFNSIYAGLGRVGDDGFGDESTLAYAIAHEAGHTFGLGHQSVFNAAGEKIAEYNPGDSETGPIMGTPYGSMRQLWWKGPSSSAISANYQDDLQVLAGSKNGFGYRADEAGDTKDSAIRLEGNGGVWRTEGVIVTAADKDAYEIEITADSTLNLVLGVADNDSAMLDGTLTLQDANGTEIGFSDLVGETAALNNIAVQPGKYYVIAGSHGSYGDVGQYRLSVSQVSAPWRQTVIGRPRVQGAIGGGEATIEGVGNGPRGAADSMNYVHQNIAGDQTLTAEIVSLDENLRTMSAGLAFRSDTTAGAMSVVLLYTPKSGVTLAHRSTAGQAVSLSAFVPVEQAPWLKLNRSGDVFTGEFSVDGVTWQFVDSVNVNMASSVLGGIFASGSPVTRDRTVQLANIKIERSIVNLPGDVNSDGTVDLLDFELVRSNFGKSEATFEEGDADRNRFIDLRDFAVIRRNYGGKPSAAGWHRLAVFSLPVCQGNKKLAALSFYPANGNANRAPFTIPTGRTPFPIHSSFN